MYFCLIILTLFSNNIKAQLNPNPNPNSEGNPESIYESRVLKVFDSGLIKTSAFSMNDVGGESHFLSLFASSEEFSFKQVDVLKHAFRDHKISKYQQLYNGIPVEGSFLTLIGAGIHAAPIGGSGDGPDGPDGPGPVGPCDGISFIKPPKDNVEALESITTQALSKKELSNHLNVKLSNIISIKLKFIISEDNQNEYLLIQDVKYINQDIEYTVRFNTKTISVESTYFVENTPSYKTTFESDNVKIKDNINSTSDIHGNVFPPPCFLCLNNQTIRRAPLACEFPGPVTTWEIALDLGQWSFNSWEDVWETGWTNYIISLHIEDGTQNARNIPNIPEREFEVLAAFTGRNCGQLRQELNEKTQWHEFGHNFLDINGLNSTTMEEGLCDIISFITNGNSRLNRYSIADRDLSDFSCVGGPNAIGGPHDRGKPIGHWYFNLTKSIGFETARDFFLEILDLLPTDGDFTYEDFMEISIELAIEKYGVCSTEFESLINEWENICMETNHPIANGEPCVEQELSSNHKLCEEKNRFNVTLEGNGGLSGLGNADGNKWVIIGSNSTEFESDLGMHGNIQQGGSALNISNIPEFPYYPQEITIKVFVAEIGEWITKRYIIQDCDGDDPDCDTYHNASSDYSEIDGGENIENSLQENYSYSIYYDIMGNKVFDTKKNLYNNNEINHIGIVFKLDFDVKGKLIETKKILNFSN